MGFYDMIIMISWDHNNHFITVIIIMGFIPLWVLLAHDYQDILFLGGLYGITQEHYSIVIESLFHFAIEHVARGRFF